MLLPLLSKVHGCLPQRMRGLINPESLYIIDLKSRVALLAYVPLSYSGHISRPHPRRVRLFGA